MRARRRKIITPRLLLLLAIFFVLLFSAAIFVHLLLPRFGTVHYEAKNSAGFPDKNARVAHLSLPVPLKGVYMTSYTAGDKTLREKIINLIDTTELNAVVIDIKDYTGRISFSVRDPMLQRIGAAEERIPDIRELIQTLHQKGIYVIGRISVFQDPYLVKARPDLAVTKKSNPRIVWRDKKGLSWLDAGAKEVWDYVAAIGREAVANGFDELNFDYIRFPSDGDMQDIAYPWSGKRDKPSVMRSFFHHLSRALRDTTAPLSADLFGMTTTAKSDLNIGQMWEDALPYFSFLSPMVYPSHYPNGFHGFDNPNHYPYQVVRVSLDSAVSRTTLASTTDKKIRPWLQDFNYGGTYGPKEVRAEMQAVYDAGLSSWMLWSAANRYTMAALVSQ